MAELSFDDFKRRIKIQDLLEDAGYRLNRKDGLRYPMYVKIDSRGQRVPGDKFMVTGGGNCCVQPPSYKNYNIISFITEHPNLFQDYTPGMDPYRLVNLVCNRILNNPVEHHESQNYSYGRDTVPFSISNYNVVSFHPGDIETENKFFPYFKSRGIDLETQRAFTGTFCLASKKGNDKYNYKNLSFPLTIPGKDGFVGFEERGIPDKEGKAYKGKAAGSNASEGLWIANLSGQPLDKASKVLWFESAYDAMSYYQLNRHNRQLARAIYVSTGGNPTEKQFRGVLSAATNAVHHLCFDNDQAGKAFSANFILVSDGQKAGCMIVDKDKLMIKNFKVDVNTFDLEEVGKVLSDTTKTKIVPQSFNDYVNSIFIKDNIFSGEPELLPAPAMKLFAKYESMSEDLYSSHRSGLVSPEDLEKLRNDTQEASNNYKNMMREALGDGTKLMIVREVPPAPHKDWNEQLIASQDQHEEITNSPRFHR